MKEEYFTYLIIELKNSEICCAYGICNCNDDESVFEIYTDDLHACSAPLVPHYVKKSEVKKIIKYSLIDGVSTEEELSF